MGGFRVDSKAQKQSALILLFLRIGLVFIFITYLFGGWFGSLIWFRARPDKCLDRCSRCLAFNPSTTWRSGA